MKSAWREGSQEVYGNTLKLCKTFTCISSHKWETQMKCKKKKITYFKNYNLGTFCWSWYHRLGKWEETLHHTVCEQACHLQKSLSHPSPVKKFLTKYAQECCYLEVTWLMIHYVDEQVLKCNLRGNVELLWIETLQLKWNMEVACLPEQILSLISTSVLVFVVEQLCKMNEWSEYCFGRN